VRRSGQRPSFASVLDQLAEGAVADADVDAEAWEEPVLDADSTAPPLDDETWAVLSARIALTMASPPDAQARLKLHRRFFDGEPGDETERQDPEKLPDLAAGLSRTDLERLRRLFARVNHPDRVPPTERIAANRRMAAFNRLIDDALRQRRPAAR
jgi:hypothetical protein